MQGYLFSFLTVLGTFAVFRLFSKITPVSQSRYLTSKPVEQLRGKYLVFDLCYTSLFLLSTGGLAFLLYQVFRLIADYRTDLIDDVLILIRTDPAILWLPALFDSLLISAVLIPVAGRKYLKEDWEEYMAYNNLKYKFNYERGMSYVLRFVAILIIPITFFALDMFSAFGEKTIHINGFLGFGTKTYTYADVRDLVKVMKVKAPNGNILNEPYVLIRFADGTEWSTRSDGFDDEQKNQEVVDLALRKTQKILGQAEFMD